MGLYTNKKQYPPSLVANWDVKREILVRRYVDASRTIEMPANADATQ